MRIIQSPRLAGRGWFEKAVSLSQHADSQIATNRFWFRNVGCCFAGDYRRRGPSSTHY